MLNLFHLPLGKDLSHYPSKYNHHQDRTIGNYLQENFLLKIKGLDHLNKDMDS